jgi:hypothetical protein
MPATVSTATTSKNGARKTPPDGMASMMAYLTRVLKIPTIGACWEELAAHARDENWSHEEYLAAPLQRQVADRESKGTTWGTEARRECTTGITTDEIRREFSVIAVIGDRTRDACTADEGPAALAHSGRG